jgi:predicted permease
LFATVGIHPFLAFWPVSLPRAENVQLDWHVLFFALAVSLLSGLLFGLAPAMRTPARNLEQTLRNGARALAGRSRHLHSSFVVSEIALAVVLLVCAGILGRTLIRLASLDPGLDIHNVLTARLELSPVTYENPARMRAAWQDVLDHARRTPGVGSVATVDTVPMRAGTNQLGYSTTASLPRTDQLPIALANSVSPDYLQVMGIPLLRGRFIDDHDRQGSEYVVVIDEVMAKLAFGSQDPVGKRVWIPETDTPFSSGTHTADAARVVGVVGHVRQWGPASDDEAKVRAQFYYPFAQVADPYMRRWSELMSVAVRTNSEPLNMIEPLKKEVSGATGDQVLNDVRTMEQLAIESLAQQRLLMLLFGIFAGLALLLACVGVYGVLAYLTSQRVSEIGVRMALGATAGNVILLVLRQSMAMIFVGVGVGIAGALAAGRLLERFVAGVKSLEPLTFAMMVFVLILAALFASFVPARRASRIDPMCALRQD